MSKKLSLLIALALLATVIAACGGGEVVEVTRVITETVVETVTVEGEETQVEVTVVVTEVVEVTPVAEEEEAAPVEKHLIVCMAQEPDTLFPYGTSMLAASAVLHGIFENNLTTKSYAYQAQGIEKVPSIADGDALVQEVEVQPGDLVRDTGDNVVAWGEGVTVMNSAGEEVTFDGNPVTMNQLVVDFTLQPRVWADGEPVKASDSVYSFGLAGSPDIPTSKYAISRTLSYEATGDLTLRWTGVPGFMDSTYYTNIWAPYPEHVWSAFSPAELLEAEESSRLPLGDGPFMITEWVAGDHITMVRNPNYYRASEGLPYLDTVTYKFIPDTNQLIAQLISGSCDIGTQDGMGADQAPFLLQAESQGLLTPYFQTGTVYEHIDFGIVPYGEYADSRPDWFGDVRVRQAMTMCTDRQGMVDNILSGRSEIIHTYVPSVHPLYPTEGLTEWPYDVEAANALLDEVGYVDSDGDGIREYTDGTPFSITLGTTSGNAMREQLTQIFQANMADCGIEVTLYYLPAGEWFDTETPGPLFGRRFDLGEFAWLTGVEPACDLYAGWQVPGPADELDAEGNPLYPSGWGGQNETGWRNEEFDAACQQAIGSLPGTPEYEEGHKQAQIIFSENVPVIPLFLRLKVAAAGSNVLNFGVDPTQNSELYNLYEIDLGQ
jgi:peptide/nickel transport system substrate-binding protein